MLSKNILCPYPVLYLQSRLNNITSGDFIMIAASTGGGKSSISRAFLQTAIANDCPTVLYSLEDEAGVIEANNVYQIALENGLNMDFKSFLIDQTEHPDKYILYRKQACEIAFRANDAGLQMSLYHEQEVDKVWELNSVLASMKEEIKLGYKLFILDHMDVLIPSEQPGDMVRGIRELWKLIAENNIALITFSQLATGRNRDSLCPGLDDLRGSKSKVHTPTVVISLGRHNYGAYTSTEEPKASPTYMRVLKDRFGGKQSAAVTFFYRGQYIDEYIPVQCNETGTVVDGKSMKDLTKTQLLNKKE